MTLNAISRGLGVIALSLSAFHSPAAYQPSTIAPPAPIREFRAAWVSSVYNGVWPSRKGLTTTEQKAELLAILDRAAQLKLNAIILQVRPMCDALYASPIEPWSEFLTGTMGKAPKPFYDPLLFAVEEAHKRGIELHAWFNSFRAAVPPSRAALAANHVSKTKPHLVREYGKHLWLDPGERESQDYSLSVVMDVLKRYDIDGVHFDDYFYPYKEKSYSGRDLDFPDQSSWQKYGLRSGLSRDDWRRDNVNRFIRRVYETVKANKPWVKFGLSPFGIWRPGSPPQIKGYDAYEELYADARKWLQNGWLDYFAPQLYWANEPKEQSFSALLKWWADQNLKSRHLWPGLNTYEVGRKWTPDEILNQIRFTRQQGTGGHIHWPMKNLMGGSSGLVSTLEKDIYAQPALVPASRWLDPVAPEKPRLTIDANGNGTRPRFTWAPTGTEKIWLWVLQTREGGMWTTQILPANRTSHAFNTALPEVVAVTAVDRCGNMSSTATLARTKP